MNCQGVMELIQRYLDRDLDGEEEEMLFHHAKQCPDCAGMLERLQRLSGELEQLPKVTPPYSLVDAIMPKLDEIDQMQASAANKRGAPHIADSGGSMQIGTSRWKARRKSWGALGGVIAAGLIFGLFITNDKLGNHQMTEIQEPSSAPQMYISAVNSEQPGRTGNENIQQTERQISGLNKELAVPNANQNQAQDSNASNRSMSAASKSEKMSDIASPAQPLEPPSEMMMTEFGFGIAATEKEEEHTMESAAAEGQMQIMSMFPEEPVSFASPDGQYIAEIDGNRVVIKQGELTVFTSILHQQESAEIVLINWENDYHMLYDVIQDGSAVRYMIDLESKSEVEIKR